MKNKEESSSDSQRGNPRKSVLRETHEHANLRTTGSPVRPDDAATASLEQPALSLIPMSLTEALVESTNMAQAWKNVKANRGAPGPDGITIAEFPAWLSPRWNAIRQQLLDGTYQPEPVRRNVGDMFAHASAS